ncbi:MAG: hypothetical protein P8184_08860 [Calditrichia bacterium]
MIILYRGTDYPSCAEIVSRLEELVVAHKIVIFDKDKPVDAPIGENTRLPALLDGEKIFSGKESILEHLEELEKFKAEWDKFQSDSCYCDDEGDIE